MKTTDALAHVEKRGAVLALTPDERALQTRQARRQREADRAALAGPALKPAELQALVYHLLLRLEELED